MLSKTLLPRHLLNLNLVQFTFISNIIIHFLIIFSVWSPFLSSDPLSLTLLRDLLLLLILSYFLFFYFIFSLSSYCRSWIWTCYHLNRHVMCLYCHYFLDLSSSCCFFCSSAIYFLFIVIVFFAFIPTFLSSPFCSPILFYHFPNI